MSLKVATPIIDTNGFTTNLSPSINVVLICSTVGAKIKYTLDGTEPNENSTLYQSSILIDSCKTIKARAYLAGYLDSDIASEAFNFKVPNPEIGPNPGNYTYLIRIQFFGGWLGQSLVKDIVIHYTLDGTEPTVNSPIYTSTTLIEMDKSVTVKAKAFKEGWIESETTTQTYNIKITTATPTFYPLNGQPPNNGLSDFECYLSCNSPAPVTIRYTTNGSEPTASSTIYSAPIKITDNVTIKAKAFKEGYIDSAIATTSYVLASKLPPPVIQPSDKSPYMGLPVTMSTQYGANIGYTFDTKEPVSIDGYSCKKYESPFVTNPLFNMIKAKAFMPNWRASDTTTVVYNVKISLPKIALSGSDTLLIFCDYPDPTLGSVDIRFTTDGSEPTSTSPKYSENTIDLKDFSADTLVKAKGFRYRYVDSETSSNLFQRQKCMKPAISPSGGKYEQAQTVSFPAYVGSVYYTLDGSEPTQKSTKYTGAFIIKENTTIKARAFNANQWASDTVVATFEITFLPKVLTPSINPAPGSYSGVLNITLNCGTESAIIRYTIDGTEPNANSNQYTGSIKISPPISVKSKAFKSGNIDSDTLTANYFALKSQNPSLNPTSGSFNGNVIVTISAATNAKIYYTLDSSDPTLQSLLYTAPINITKSSIIKAKSYQINQLDSDIVNGTYIIDQKPIPPIINPLLGIQSTNPSALSSIGGSDTTVLYANHKHQSSGGIASLTANLIVNSNYTSEASIISAVIPQNLMKIGTTFRIIAEGYLYSTMASPILWNIKLGTNMPIPVVSIQTNTGQNTVNQHWHFEALVTIRTMGTTGKAVGRGHVFGSFGSNGSFVYLGETKNITQVDIDTTVTNTLSLNFKFGILNPVNNLFCDTATIEVLKM
jgi:hypothetical protein